MRRLRDRTDRAESARTDAGMTTAEYAVGTVAACGFAGILLKLLTSGGIVSLLENVIVKALHLPF
jgi:uncharacterized protein DUF4244